MNRRFIETLEILLKNKGESSYKDLSEILFINEKTIRYDIDKIKRHRPERPVPLVCTVCCRVLHPATFVVIFHSTGMQGCGQAVTDHLLFIKIAERRMQFLEVGKIVEHRFDNCVDDLVRHIGRGDDSGTHAKGSGIVW